MTDIDMGALDGAGTVVAEQWDARQLALLDALQAIDLPVEVSAIDSFASVTDAPERSLSLVARIPIDLADVYLGDDKKFCDTLDRCRDVSLFLLERSDSWLGD